MHRRPGKILVSLLLLAAVFQPVAEAAPDRQVVTHVQTDRKLIALTFDDGPNPEYTPQILDLLAQYQAKATFFVLGSRVRRFPELANREVNEGHEIANHTFDHHYSNHLTPSELKEEIRKTQQAILDVTEQSPRVFRPPGGLYDQSLLELALQDHLTVVTWSWYQDTKDWKRPGVANIVHTVLTNVHNGDIVLFHDMEGDCTQTVAALRIILPALQERGYRFVTVTDLIRTSQKGSK